MAPMKMKPAGQEFIRAHAGIYSTTGYVTAFLHCYQITQRGFERCAFLTAKMSRPMMPLRKAHTSLSELILTNADPNSDPLW